MSGRTLGLIGCYGLSDQILFLIDRDRSIDKLFVVDNHEGRMFVKKMEERFVEKRLFIIDEADLPLQGNHGFSVLLWLNPEDMHNSPPALWNRQEEILSRLSDHVDSTLFCYGLCRSPEQRIKNTIKQARVPVTFLTDACGEIVDDCFAAILGGKEKYLCYNLSHKGALFATTGYVEAWKRRHEMMDIESIVLEAEGLKQMFEALDYRHIIKLDDGTGDRDQFAEDLRMFSRTFDMELITEKCHLEVFELSYDLAKWKMGRRKRLPLEQIAAETSLSLGIASPHQTSNYEQDLGASWQISNLNSRQ